VFISLEGNAKGTIIDKYLEYLEAQGKSADTLRVTRYTEPQELDHRLRWIKL